ncbi:MAG TPA: diaminopimelate decarboxylase [Symbiobacteriaceae bacterium]|nr:diaminopimelate decarboxylase [Symbiobacteriaceae bacterium]
MHYYGTAAKNALGHLTIGGVDTMDLAKEFGTPLYIMDEELIRKNCQAYVGAFAKRYPNAEVAFASKAFLCSAMAALVAQEGMALDVVSGGEIATAVHAGFPMERTYFHGNNKTPREIELALSVGVGRIIVDSVHELHLLNRIAGEQGVTPKIYLRLTPNVGAHGHHYISTGQLDSKFGIPIETGDALEATKLALSAPNVELTGFHCHIGSQIHDLEGYRVAAGRMLRFVAEAKAATGFAAHELNLGGGLGVRYVDADTPKRPEVLVDFIAQIVEDLCAELGLDLPKLILEPGRSIVGEAGTTLYSIGTVKEIPGVRTYISVDGGMGDNIRPALYQAEYECVVANKLNVPADKVVSVAGRYCESGDMLLTDAKVAHSVDTGDLLAVFTTGAYNYSMASHYNRYPKPAVVFVSGGKAELVVRRESFQEMAAFDLIPDRMKAAAVK